MSLLETVNQDLTAAMKTGENLRRDVLRMLKSSLKNLEIELGKELTDEDVTNIIGREVKKRKESITAYEQAGKPDLAKDEQAELDILQAYLPTQMEEAEIRQFVTDYLAKNPTDQSQVGQAMGRLSAELKGKADLGFVSKILRELVK